MGVEGEYNYFYTNNEVDIITIELMNLDIIDFNLQVYIFNLRKNG